MLKRMPQSYRGKNVEPTPYYKTMLQPCSLYQGCWSLTHTMTLIAGRALRIIVGPRAFRAEHMKRWSNGRLFSWALMTKRHQFVAMSSPAGSFIELDPTTTHLDSFMIEVYQVGETVDCQQCVRVNYERAAITDPRARYGATNARHTAPLSWA